MLPSSLDYIFKKNFSLFYILKHQNFLGYLFGYKIFVLQSHPPPYIKTLKFQHFRGGGATLVLVKVFFWILGAILCDYERNRFWCGVFFFAHSAHENTQIRLKKAGTNGFSDVLSVCLGRLSGVCEKAQRLGKIEAQPAPVRAVLSFSTISNTQNL